MLSTGSRYPREAGGDTDTTGTAVTPSFFNTAGLQVAGDQCRLLLGSAPYEPRIALPFSKVALSGDFCDLQGYLSTPLAGISTVNSQLVNSNTLNASDIYADYTQSQQVDTETLTSNGVPVFCDWNATSTDLPTIQLINNPLKTGLNSDGSKGGFQLENMLIGAAESVGTEALLYFGKSAGSWLLSLGQDCLSLFNGYATLGEAGLSIGGSAASTAAAAGGDLALFEAGSEGLVMASSASEAASMFSSAGVLSELGTGFSTAAGEAGEGLLSGITSSTAELEEVIASHDLVSSLAGTARWIAF